MVAVVDEHDAPRNRAREWAAQTRCRTADVVRGDRPGKWRVGRRVGAARVDEADRACGTGGPWAGRDRVDADVPAPPCFVGKGAGIGFERGLGGGHAATVAWDHALAGEIAQGEKGTVVSHERRQMPDERDV